MSHNRPQQEVAGYVYASFAYLMWGLFPIFWKQLKAVDAIEILAHRVLWSALFMSVVILIARRNELKTFLRARGQRARALVATLFCAAAVAGNWYLYVWAVNTDHVVEASLGYYINPLISVLLGILVLRERPRTLELVALSVALVDNASGSVLVGLGVNTLSAC